MIEFFADFCFAFEAVEQNRVGFHFRVGNLDRDGASRRAVSVPRKIEAMPLRATRPSMR